MLGVGGGDMEVNIKNNAIMDFTGMTVAEEIITQYDAS